MKNIHSRRNFIKKTAVLGATVAMGSTLVYLNSGQAEISRPINNLLPDPNGICDLPKGFTYRVISTYEDIMNDGLSVPGALDGMACFNNPAGGMILVRNHEIARYLFSNPKSPVPAMAYDTEAAGGTTTIWLNDQLEVTNQYLSLTGTIMNCCGGKTPWNTWISSEEATPGFPGGTWSLGKRHGYNFEVDPFSPIQKAEPLKAMGRFKHEAVAIDPETGIAYQTEDQMLGCFYRFIPNSPGHLAEGGVLQALKFKDMGIKHTTQDALVAQKSYPCEWVNIDEPDPEEDSVRLQAKEKGAAVFVRGEGIIAATDGIYFACTAGGAMGKGQIFKLIPGVAGESDHIQLVFEANTPGVLEKPDNITVSNWGDLIICEDNGLSKQCLVGLTPKGQVYYIASNTQAEWAGVCFSPDGRTLFANIHEDPGMTLAIQGPWETLRTNL
ncbi:alkaline phosphatase PhoX [Marinicella sp. W31]|uniref:alkaline phosphatase PhoX n=1 Tax=Marinicella sp. W31 TaxID=3023713 RepID=UPI003758493D